MNEVYININELGKWTESLFREKLGYGNKDIITIADLISSIEDLYSEIERLEEELDYYKNKEEYRPTFDYSEWKANQE